MTCNTTLLRFPRCAAALGALLVPLIAAPAVGVTIPTVLVGNAGYAGVGQSTFGAVSYNYRIGTTEVTNAQYAEFLNLKAASDPLGLYHAEMGSLASGGIARSGSDGSYSYTTKENMGDKPVNIVSWYDAVRFANWLHNGQGTGDTETGAYTLGQLGPFGVPINGSSITRNAGATWFLPSQNEWYKAAYHQPSAQGGDDDDFWLYPTASNSAPTIATANSVGDISNPGPNVANYHAGADWNNVDGGNVTTVGSAGPLSYSFYGTADQGGNVQEWNETLQNGPTRGLRGGAFNNTAPPLSALGGGLLPQSEPFTLHPTIGFRVATVAIVPEPSTAVLAIVGGLLMLCWSKRRR